MHLGAGKSTASWPEVAAFYEHWSSFVTYKEFSWVDQYNPASAANRKVGLPLGRPCCLANHPTSRTLMLNSGSFPSEHHNARMLGDALVASTLGPLVGCAARVT